MVDVAHRRWAWLETMAMQQHFEADTIYISENKDLGELLEMNLAMRELFFDVKVESQAELPHNPAARINMATHFYSMGIFDLEEFVQFTGIQVRPQLREQLRAASEFFLPAVPIEQQSEIRMQLELARLEMQKAQGVSAGGSGGGGQRALPSPAGEAGGTDELGSSVGPAGNPNQRPL